MLTLSFGLYLGIADGMSIARVWACRYSKRPPRKGGHFEYRHAHTRAVDMPSAMPKRLFSDLDAAAHDVDTVEQPGDVDALARPARLDLV